MAHQATHSPAFVTRISPEPPEEIKTDEKNEEWEPQSLEEALLGE